VLSALTNLHAVTDTQSFAVCIDFVIHKNVQGCFGGINNFDKLDTCAHWGHDLFFVYFSQAKRNANQCASNEIVTACMFLVLSHHKLTTELLLFYFPNPTDRFSRSY